MSESLALLNAVGLVVLVVTPVLWVYAEIRDQRAKHQAHLARCRRACEERNG